MLHSFRTSRTISTNTHKRKLQPNVFNIYRIIQSTTNYNHTINKTTLSTKQHYQQNHGINKTTLSTKLHHQKNHTVYYNNTSNTDTHQPPITMVIKFPYLVVKYFRNGIGLCLRGCLSASFHQHLVPLGQFRVVSELFVQWWRLFPSPIPHLRTLSYIDIYIYLYLFIFIYKYIYNLFFLFFYSFY